MFHRRLKEPRLSIIAPFLMSDNTFNKWDSAVLKIMFIDELKNSIFQIFNLGRDCYFLSINYHGKPIYCDVFILANKNFVLFNNNKLNKQTHGNNHNNNELLYELMSEIIIRYCQRSKCSFENCSLVALAHLIT